MESARSLGKNKIGFAGGFYYNRFPIPVDSLTSDYDRRNQSQVYFDFDFRLGVLKNLDIGIKYKFPFSSGIDTKYQFIGTKQSRIALAIGASVIRSFGDGISVYKNDTDNQDFKLPKNIITIPLLFSYYNNPFHSFFVPQYSIILDKSRSDAEKHQFIGGTFGWAIRNNHVEFKAGISYFESLNTTFHNKRHLFGMSLGYSYFFD